MSDPYVHGYSAEEQQRLVSQALYLEDGIYHQVDFADATRLLEIGCGVGAQLSILRRRFPELHLTGVDRSQEQLAAARALLAADLEAGRTTLVESDGGSLPFASGAFDAVFLCWVLEHAPSPAPLLREAHRVLAPGGKLVCTEVFNHSFYVRPACSALSEYWHRFNAFQEELGGDPDVGLRVPAMVAEAGFQVRFERPLPWLLDRRLAAPTQRRDFLGYWQAVLLSAAPALMAAGRIDEALIRGLKQDFARLAGDHDALFYVTAIQTQAVR